MLEKLFHRDGDAQKTSETTNPETEQQALDVVAACTNETELVQLALHSSFTKARQAAAARLNEPGHWHELEKNSQDKAVQHLVREKIRDHKQQQLAEQDLQQQIEGICLKLEHLSQHSQTPLFEQQLHHLAQEWSALDRAATGHLQARFDAAHSVCQEIVTALAAEQAAALRAQQEQEAAEAARKAAWASVTEEQQKAFAEAAQRKEQSEADKQQHAKQQAQLEQGLKGVLTAIEVALQEGQISQLAKKFKNAQSKLDALDRKTAHLYEGKLVLLQKQLQEMRDWQSFVALPKKQELCEKMDQLAARDMTAPERAAAIHELQEQWRNIKGGHHTDEQKLWDQFKLAADKAYEPCKAYFEQQKILRTENLRQRETICAELENYYRAYDWEKADWRAVDKIIETAKQEFHRFSPVDHKQLTPIKTRFDAAVKPIIEKLRQEQKRNEALKVQLIEQAKKLLEQTDTHAAIDGAKKLQQQWKQVGITRPHEDNRLWQQFRKGCDAIFARRSAEKEQAQENLKQEITKAEQLCKQIEALAALPDGELQKSQENYNSLRKEFLALPLSKEKQQTVFRHFYKVCDHYQHRVGGIKERKQQAGLQEAFRRAALCEQLESGADAASIETQWPGEVTLAADIGQALEQRYQKALKVTRGETTLDPATNEKQRRLILIRLEILKGRETPAEDKGLRMEFQLKQLSAGLGKKPIDNKQEQQALMLEWLGTAAGLPEHREKLQQRFEALTTSC